MSDIDHCFRRYDFFLVGVNLLKNAQIERDVCGVERREKKRER